MFTKIGRSILKKLYLPHSQALNYTLYHSEKYITCILIQQFGELSMGVKPRPLGRIV